MTMLQTHMLINKKSVSKGTQDAILLRLAHSAISSPKQKNNNKKLTDTRGRVCFQTLKCTNQNTGILSLYPWLYIHIHTYKKLKIKKNQIF